MNALAGGNQETTRKSIQQMTIVEIRAHLGALEGQLETIENLPIARNDKDQLSDILIKAISNAKSIIVREEKKEEEKKENDTFNHEIQQIVEAIRDMVGVRDTTKESVLAIINLKKRSIGIRANAVRETIKQGATENNETQIAVAEDILKKNVHQMDMSVRLSNMLENHNIKTIGDIINFPTPWSTVYKFGPISLMELKELLLRAGVPKERVEEII